MQKVTGIGCILFKAQDPEAMAKWYEENLGIPRGIEGGQWKMQTASTVFSPLTKDTDYFGTADQGVMFNFRVENLVAMLSQLRDNGVKIDEKRQEEAYGKFAWVYDLEGNKVELWEAIE